MADQPTEARLALYRKLSTEHLQTLLRSDLDGPPLDEATVDSILTVLAERRRTPADTSAAWQDFSAYYSTPDSPGAPVRRTRAHLQKAYTRLRIPIRVVSAAAAMFVLIFALFPRVETGASDAPNAYVTGRTSISRSALCRMQTGACRRAANITRTTRACSSCTTRWQPTACPASFRPGSRRAPLCRNITSETNSPVPSRSMPTSPCRTAQASAWISRSSRSLPQWREAGS